MAFSIRPLSPRATLRVARHSGRWSWRVVDPSGGLVEQGEALDQIGAMEAGWRVARRAGGAYPEVIVAATGT
jgi:hypothetical protein